MSCQVLFVTMTGYDQNFLDGDPLPMPGLSPRLAAVAFDGGSPIDHTRFSIIHNQERGLAICTAHTIEGSTMLPEGAIPRTDRFRFDVLVDNDLQIDDDRGYRNNRWDRGHLVRRRSLHWGDENEARTADNESYFWTNIAPQHERLHDTAWGPIEDWMLATAEVGRHRAAVFTGPILTDDDAEHVNGPNELPFQVPAGYWKVIVVPRDGTRSVAAFLVWQRDHDIQDPDAQDPVTFNPVLEQVRITTIEFLTGLSFVELRPLDPLAFDDDVEPGSVPMGTPRGARAGISDSRPILSPNDILL